MGTVVSQRDLWNAMCYRAITKLEYSVISQEQFLEEMSRLGWEREIVEELIRTEEC